ncbi:MAG: hypothetical protein H0V69_14285 [Acidimicrobiia bacterium]|nr:hypothetical protein [Acidimicrobiia bacterium]
MAEAGAVVDHAPDLAPLVIAGGVGRSAASTTNSAWPSVIDGYELAMRVCTPNGDDSAATKADRQPVIEQSGSGEGVGGLGDLGCVFDVPSSDRLPRRTTLPDNPHLGADARR